jgi:hypothetical protein
MTDLKPCPFCVGGGDLGTSWDDWGYRTILCKSCKAAASPTKWSSRPEEDRLRQRLRESVARELHLKAVWVKNGTTSARGKRIIFNYACLICNGEEPAWVTKAIFGEE